MTYYLNVKNVVLITACLFCTYSATAQDVALVCTICNGQGTQKCSLCEGKGKWKAEVGGKRKNVECPACKGTEIQPCWLCDGSGKDVGALFPNTNSQHSEEYSWLWCSSCKHQGLNFCTRCEGRGKVYTVNGDALVCNLCGGKRYVLCSSCKGACGWYVKRVKCEVCEGDGSISCSQCNGLGWFPPENVDKAFAEVCKQCKGHGLVPHKECEGSGCKNCKNGKLKCKQCGGHGAIIITPEPKYKDCMKCSHKGVQRCSACSGRGYRNITEEGVVK